MTKVDDEVVRLAVAKWHQYIEATAYERAEDRGLGCVSFDSGHDADNTLRCSRCKAQPMPPDKLERLRP